MNTLLSRGRPGRAAAARVRDPAGLRRLAAAQQLLPHLERGQRVDAAIAARRHGSGLRRLRRRRRLGLEDGL